jgi:hypothetical protein
MGKNECLWMDSEYVLLRFDDTKFYGGSRVDQAINGRRVFKSSHASDDQEGTGEFERIKRDHEKKP